MNLPWALRLWRTPRDTEGPGAESAEQHVLQEDLSEDLGVLGSHVSKGRAASWSPASLRTSTGTSLPDPLISHLWSPKLGEDTPRWL